MKPSGSGALCDLPAVGRWDFGGFAYGLELLIPPAVGDPDGSADAVPAGNYAESCRRLAALGERGLLTPEVQPCESPSELFWFRWLTGHQVCFIVWRLIAQLVDDLNQGCRSADEVLSQISHYVDGYSAMPGGPVQRRRLSASARTAPRRDRATGGHERRLHT